MLIYDGDCGFCKGWVVRWQGLTGDRVEYAPLQELSASDPDLPREALEQAVHLVEVDGRTTRGAEAVFGSLRHAPGWGVLKWLYERAPGFAPLTERAYRFVAEHRGGLSRLQGIWWGRDVTPPRHALSSWLLMRWIAGVYLLAFASLRGQISGLIGAEGILPVTPYLSAVHGQFGATAYRLLPTLAWLDSGDRALEALCSAGIIVAFFTMIGLTPRAGFIALWALYLSLLVAGREFMAFQWDALLLESGFLAIFLAPWSWKQLRPDREPGSLRLFLFRWLLFRLMLQSGIVKLASGDESWWSLQALRVHFETQPLPTWIGWYAHQLPARILDLSVLAMFVIELGAVWFIFGPRRQRRLAAALLIALQLGIALTGNYTFFNLLSIGLCLPLLDDRFLGALRWRRRAKDDGADDHPRPGIPRLAPFAPRAGRLGPLPLMALVALILTLSVPPLIRSIDRDRAWPRPWQAVERAARPFRSVNSYGLFAVMTQQRREIRVEGSHDGQNWKAYRFPYKPGLETARPRFVAPHQPRLDWQMWFAALGPAGHSPWFGAFLARLLEGSPRVTDLLAENPFPDSPPRFVRARLMEYHFSSPTERAESGRWWIARPLGVFAPSRSLPGAQVHTLPGDASPAS